MIKLLLSMQGKLHQYLHLTDINWQLIRQILNVLYKQTISEF